MPYLCILSDTSILQYFSTQQKWHVLSLNCQTSSSSLWYCTAQLPLCLQGQSHHFFQKCFTIPWNGSVVHSQSFRLPRVAQVLQPPIRPHSGGREVLQGPPLRGPWCFVLFFSLFFTKKSGQHPKIQKQKSLSGGRKSARENSTKPNPSETSRPIVSVIYCYLMKCSWCNAESNTKHFVF